MKIIGDLLGKISLICGKFRTFNKAKEFIEK